MSKWCSICYRNEMSNEWRSCEESCPIFGMDFEELPKRIFENLNTSEAIKKETAEKIATYLEDHWGELERAWLFDDKSSQLRGMIAKAIQN